MKKITSTPFRELELQLLLEKLDKEWEEAKKNYNKKDATAESADEILKLSVEKIKVLSEIYMLKYEA
jgi:hypothetical protein